MATPAIAKQKTSFPITLLLSCLLGVLAFLARSHLETLPEQFPFLSYVTPSGISLNLRSRSTTQPEEHHHEICPKSNATIRIFSSNPLIIYIPDFISKSEREHLKTIAQPLFKRSTVAKEEIYDDVRTSSSAFLPENDTVINCIRQRAADFQGHVSLGRIEVLQLVRYRPGEEYKAHLDWDEGDAEEDLRTSTFFAYVGCDGCEGGSTKFYSIARKAMSREWCNVIDCTASGIEFLPIPGSAIFWENVDENGQGRKEMLHSGMPLTKGVKYGLNIWTRQKSTGL